MANNETFVFRDIVADIGETGMRMTEIEAAEGAAGNISVFVRELDGLDDRFHLRSEIELPVDVPALSEGWLVVSGTGCRLRDLGADPAGNLCVLHIHPGGEIATQFSGTNLRPTSEFNSHLAIHDDQVMQRGLTFHAVLHAQPPYLSFLSHLPQYESTRDLNRRLLHWEPETVAAFPEGIGFIPFQVPGSSEQMTTTRQALLTHRMVLWARHGAVSRSDVSVRKAGNLMEYAETAARFEYLNRQLGEPCQGISDEDMRAICAKFGIRQDFF
jgi:rhamnulose-1-phosphate aldolase